jgi:uncharacterized 2Fe-2S/4Fe-4S cluster protein (DUF4445 family)
MMPEKFNITFKVEAGETAIASGNDGESLLEIAQRVGIAIDVPCSGNSTCGKCRVRLIEGSIDSGNHVEQSRHITTEDWDEGVRLACMSHVSGDATVFVSASASAWRTHIKVTDMSGEREQGVFAEMRAALRELELAGDSGLELVTVSLTPPDLGDALADEERLLRALADSGADETYGISLHALRKLPHALRAADFSVRCLLRREDKNALVLDVFPNTEQPVITGLAVDIGTTTVSMLLVDLQSGEPLAAGSAGNAQIRYGADVISRIIESGKTGGLERLRRAVINECVAPLITSLCERVGLAPTSIYRVTVAANTTMTHLFTGVCAEFIRLEPYIPAFFQPRPFRAFELGLDVHPDAETLLAPNIGSYVGGDITAGVLSSMLFNQTELSLLIDLGTNGELVLGNQDFLISCACSAGPAFEGGDISCGMRATDGAIEACRIDADTLEPALTIIGGKNQKPTGVCGSGLIDMIGELFHSGAINAKGRFVRDIAGRITRDQWGGAGYIIASDGGRDLVLTETDIDNFIRAKAAIFSAIRTMLASLDMPVDAITQVFVAGGIGSGINIGQAIAIGMFPRLPLDRYRYIGNSSMYGAYSMLTSRKAADKVTDIANSMTYLELSAIPTYMEEFVAASFLPHTNGALFE